MRDITVLLTATGCPGAATVINILRKVKDRRIRIVGTDTSETKIGRFLCDDFYVVNLGNSNEFIDDLENIITKYEPDILFPQSSSEVINIAQNKKRLESHGVKVLISDINAVELSENKKKLYEKMQTINVKIPKYFVISTMEELLYSLDQLGYPKRSVCFKPPLSKGTRGFRILSENINRKSLLLYHRPIERYISLADFQSIFNNGEIPELLLMEYIDGPQFTSDPLLYQNEMLLCPIKTRENERCGLAMLFQQVENEAILESTKIICNEIKLDYIVNIQFIGDYLIELNPRISTVIYHEGLNIPYLAIQLALEEVTPQTVKNMTRLIKPGRFSLRYYNQIFF